MATGIYDSRHAPHSQWSTSVPGNSGFAVPGLAPPPNLSSRQRYQPYAPSPSRPPGGSSPNPLGYDRGPTGFASHNEVEMTREMLMDVLEYFSSLLPTYFDWNIIQNIAASTSSTKAPPLPIPVSQPKITGMRLVVHGGACMLLHPGLYQLSQQQQKASPNLPVRTKTRDVDYIHRGFMTEYSELIPDAAERMKQCIQATARRFNLGADWMNSDADIALPMAHDPADGLLYDPIYTASVIPQNIALHTIFRSTNGFLTLISVTPSWAVSLKLVRYTKWDPGDICLLLRNGTLLSNTQWTPEMLEGWLLTECWAMGYVNFDTAKKSQMRSRIDHAIQTLAQWTRYVASNSSPPGRTTASAELASIMLPISHDSSGHSSPWSRSSGSRAHSRVREKSRVRDREHGRVHGDRDREQGRVHSDREREQSRPRSDRDQGSIGSKNRSQVASRIASRANTPEDAEIFIPPDVHIEEDLAAQYGAHYDERYDERARRDRGRPEPYRPARAPVIAPERSTQGSWAAPAPQGNVRTIQDPITQSQSMLVNGPPMGGERGNSSWHRQARNVPGPDPYSMHMLEDVIGSIPTHTNSPANFNHAENYAGVGAGAGGAQPVVPGVSVPDPSLLQYQRRKNDKQRQLERQRARGSKWRSASETEDSDESDEDQWATSGARETATRTHQRQRSSRSDPALKAGQSGGPWQDMYEAPVLGRSSSAQPQPTMYTQGRAAARGYPPFIPPPPGITAADMSARQLSNNFRPSEREREREAVRPIPRTSGENKRRPPALDLDESPTVPPGQLAQWQFEQQQEIYQREREQQKKISERERMFYEQRQFAQVPTRARPVSTVDERMYRPEIAYPQPQRPGPVQMHMPSQYHQPPPHMSQMSQPQRGAYR